MKSSAQQGMGPGRLKALSVAAAAIFAFQGIALAVNPHRPVISNITPAFGPIEGGTTVTFTGTNLRTPITVSFAGHAGTSCDFSGITGTSGTFTCDTPVSTALGQVTVIVKNHSKGNSGSLVIPNGFTYTCDSCSVSPVSALIEGIAPTQTTTEPNGILEPGESAQSFSPTWLNPTAVNYTGTSFTGALSSPLLPGGTLTTSVASAQYPALNAGTSGQCTTCYTVGASFTAARPSVHVDATVVETPSIVGVANPDTADAHTWTIHIGNSFPDVPSSFLLYTFIERLVHKGVTLGNNDGTFNPNGTTIRNQIAAFIARGAAGGDANVPTSGTISAGDNPTVNGSYNCAPAGTTLYNDVAPTDGFCKHIHYITGLNITTGCDSHVPKPNFCENTTVTRTVMAVFLARAIVSPDGDALVPDANTGTGAFTGRSYDCVNGPSPFSDVALGGFCKQIGFLWTLGIVDGNNGAFGPNDPVTRAQMAKFLDNAFLLSINNP
jgi:hypothetical protein